MQISTRKSLCAGVGGISALATLLSVTTAAPEFRLAQLPAQEIVLALDPAQTKVDWNVDSTLHMVHGTFVVKYGAVRFDPDTGKVGGEIVVLTTSGESGNTSRDRRKVILETERYPEAVSRPDQIDGKVARSGGSDVQLRGAISLHGSEHEISVPVHVELDGNRWKGTAKFNVPYIRWGIKDPSNWMLKVKPVVNVELIMTGPEKASN